MLRWYFPGPGHLEGDRMSQHPLRDLRHETFVDDHRRQQDLLLMVKSRRGKALLQRTTKSFPGSINFHGEYVNRSHGEALYGAANERKSRREPARNFTRQVFASFYYFCSEQSFEILTRCSSVKICTHVCVCVCALFEFIQGHIVGVSCGNEIIPGVEL